MKAPITIQEISHPALDLLDQAEREFAAGDICQASAKLWGAATHAVAAVATERGWPCDSDRLLKDAVVRLSNEQDDDMRLQSEYGAAEKFHINMYYDLMEDFEIEIDRTIVHRFVHRTLALLQNPQPAKHGA